MREVPPRCEAIGPHGWAMDGPRCVLAEGHEGDHVTVGVQGSAHQRILELLCDLLCAEVAEVVNPDHPSRMEVVLRSEHVSQVVGEEGQELWTRLVLEDFEEDPRAR